jgi:hypothetical protein
MPSISRSGVSPTASRILPETPENLAEYNVTYSSSSSTFSYSSAESRFPSPETRSLMIQPSP